MTVDMIKWQYRFGLVLKGSYQRLYVSEVNGIDVEMHLFTKRRNDRPVMRN